MRSPLLHILHNPAGLLAWEVADRLNEEYKVPCDLLTGQERTELDGARHVACTVSILHSQSQEDDPLMQMLPNEMKHCVERCQPGRGDERFTGFGGLFFGCSGLAHWLSF